MITVSEKKEITKMRVTTCLSRRTIVLTILAGLIFCVIQILKYEIGYNDADESYGAKL